MSIAVVGNGDLRPNVAEHCIQFAGTIDTREALNDVVAPAA